MGDIQFGTTSFKASPFTPPLLDFPSIQSVRVIDIILSEDHPKFNAAGQWSGIGAIEFEPIKQESSLTYVSNTLAKPYFSNLRFYPVINEVVNIISSPNPESNRGKNTDHPEFNLYYLPPSNLWNSTHVNALPKNNVGNTSTSRKNYDEVSKGMINRSDETYSTPFLGKEFEELENATPLYYYEGDHILEGRWGNTIRLGSTIKDSKYPNNWSNVGDKGKPIIIIKNSSFLPKTKYSPLIEDVNLNDSSIYLTSTQKIPLTPSSFNTDSFKSENNPSHPSEYEKPQIILTSGRLVLNAKTDGILLSSPKSVHLSSGGSVNLDSKVITLSSSKLYLIDKDAKHPAVLGDELLLVFDVLVNLLGALKTGFEGATNSGGPIPTINRLSANIEDARKDMKKQLKKINSSQIKLQ